MRRKRSFRADDLPLVVDSCRRLSQASCASALLAGRLVDRALDSAGSLVDQLAGLVRGLVDPLLGVARAALDATLAFHLPVAGNGCRGLLDAPFPLLGLSAHGTPFFLVTFIEPVILPAD